jgi:hypothetical protein
MALGSLTGMGENGMEKALRFLETQGFPYF